MVTDGSRWGCTGFGREDDLTASEMIWLVWQSEESDMEGCD